MCSASDLSATAAFPASMLRRASRSSFRSTSRGDSTLRGAGVSTLGIFLPSFVFVAILNPIIPRLRNSAWSASFLDAVNAAAVGLMAAVVIELALSTLVTWQAAVIALSAALAVFFLKLNSAYLVLAGAFLGWALSFLF